MTLMLFYQISLFNKPDICYNYHPLGGSKGANPYRTKELATKKRDGPNATKI